MVSINDSKVIVMTKSEFVILGDVQILFPPNDYVFNGGAKVEIALTNSLSRLTSNDQDKTDDILRG